MEHLEIYKKKKFIELMLNDLILYRKKTLVLFYDIVAFRIFYDISLYLFQRFSVVLLNYFTYLFFFVSGARINLTFRRFNMFIDILFSNLKLFDNYIIAGYFNLIYDLDSQ
jgi:hypothetical protein